MFEIQVRWKYSPYTDFFSDSIPGKTHQRLHTFKSHVNDMQIPPRIQMLSAKTLRCAFWVSITVSKHSPEFLGHAPEC